MDEIAKYEWGDSEISLDYNIIRKNVAKNEKVTDEECFDFLMLCKAQHLNPFIREAYLVKYGDSPATLIVGKDVFLKRAEADDNFEGFEAGITAVAADGSLKRREGSLLLPGEVIVGGWCRVYKRDREHPNYDEVSFDEYASRKRDGTLNAQWAGKPATMIRKVAIVHALREAFPDRLQALYDASEMGVDDSKLSTTPIETDAIVTDATMPEKAPETPPATTSTPNRPQTPTTCKRRLWQAMNAYSKQTGATMAAVMTGVGERWGCTIKDDGTPDLTEMTDDQMTMSALDFEQMVSQAQETHEQTEGDF